MGIEDKIFKEISSMENIKSRIDQFLENLPKKPKLEISNYIEQEGILTPERFQGLKQALDYVKSGIIIQDQGTCDCAANTDTSGTTTASSTTVNIPENVDGITLPFNKQACGYLEAKIK